MWEQYFCESGNVEHRKNEVRTRTDQVTVEKLRDMFENYPNLSILQASQTLDISAATVYRVLRPTLFLFPYKLQNYHDFPESDQKKRVEFAKHCQAHPVGCDEFLSLIVFSDECIFRLNGVVRNQNLRIWSTERPKENNRVVMNSSSLIVRRAIFK